MQPCLGCIFGFEPQPPGDGARTDEGPSALKPGYSINLSTYRHAISSVTARRPSTTPISFHCEPLCGAKVALWTIFQNPGKRCKAMSWEDKCYYPPQGPKNPPRPPICSTATCRMAQNRPCGGFRIGHAARKRRRGGFPSNAWNNYAARKRRRGGFPPNVWNKNDPVEDSTFDSGIPHVKDAASGERAGLLARIG